MTSRTPEQQRAFEIQAYGCTGAEVDEGIAECATWNQGDLDKALVSILSDAQAAIECAGDVETARQYMNRVKRALMNRERLQAACDEASRNDTIEFIHNVHKDIYGCRPRRDFSAMSVTELDVYAAELCREREATR